MRSQTFLIPNFKLSAYALRARVRVQLSVIWLKVVWLKVEGCQVGRLNAHAWPFA